MQTVTVSGVHGLCPQIVIVQWKMCKHKSIIKNTDYAWNVSASQITAYFCLTNIQVAQSKSQYTYNIRLVVTTTQRFL